MYNSRSRPAAPPPAPCWVITSQSAQKSLPQSLKSTASSELQRTLHCNAIEVVFPCECILLSNPWCWLLKALPRKQVWVVVRRWCAGSGGWCVSNPTSAPLTRVHSTHQPSAATPRVSHSGGGTTNCALRWYKLISINFNSRIHYLGKSCSFLLLLATLVSF